MRYSKRSEEKRAWLNGDWWWMRGITCLYSVETRVQGMITHDTVQIQSHLRVATL